MDPLSIAAGTAGFVALTIQLSDKISKFIKAWKNAGEDVVAFNHLVKRLRETFDVLQVSIRKCRLSTSVVDLVHDHLKACQSSLAMLLSELAELGLIQDSNGGPIPRTKQIHYAWRASKIKKLEEICEALKARLGFTLSILTM